MTQEKAQQQIQPVQEMILSTFGIRVQETHYKNVAAFIEKRLAVRNETISDYIKALSDDREEYVRFVDEITINESYFFRDSRHYSLLYNEILHELFQKRSHITIWSAAAATGEEALSIAAMCHAVLKDYPGKDFSVYASDINTAALNRITEGRYSKSAFRADGAEFHSLLLPCVTQTDNGIIIDASIRKHVIILEHNLYTGDYSGFPDDFDLIMLRNVFIYMPMENRNQVLFHIVPRLRNSGYLFLSASEVPLIWHPDLKITEKEGIYFFHRATSDEKSADRISPRLHTPLAGPCGKKTLPGESSAAGENKKKPFLDTGKLYESVNRQVFNPLYTRRESLEDTYAERIVQLMYHSNEGKSEDARAVLAQLQNDLPHNEVILFYSGVIAKREGNREESLRFFQKALDVQQEFWPARYERAMKIKEQAPLQAKQQFSLCVKHIYSYIKKGKYVYHFLLDGFNALYFLQICEYWEKRLETESEQLRRIE